MKNVENKINQLQTKSILKHGIKQIKRFGKVPKFTELRFGKVPTVGELKVVEPS